LSGADQGGADRGLAILLYLIFGLLGDLSLALARRIGRDGGAVRHLEFGVGGCGGGGTAARYFWAAWADEGVRPSIFCGRRVVGDFFYYVKGIVEPGVVGVLYRDVEGADDP
jgi:hypothetical protein